MSKTIIPANYTPALNLYDTQRAIGTVKRLFADTLCATLNLYRVSAPLFLEASTGLNDDLNGVERKVTFDIKDSGIEAQVVQSLAKWKRKALKDYDFHVGKGLYCDMNAIRRDEELDNLHSVYVDQWDWEKAIRLEDRSEAYLKSVVRSIVSAVCATEMNLHAMFPQLQELPLHSPNVTFITTQELEDKYPDLTPKERENAFVKENGTTFLMKIGAPLKSGKPHDGRAPDYDDWDLNGDLLFWNDPLQCSYELSSMGIRVSPESMDRQLTAAGCDDRAFATPEGKAALDALTHPEIVRRIRAAKQAAQQAGAKLFVLDGAVIIGTAAEAECDKLCVVTAPFEVSVERIAARDGISPEMAARRLNAQTPEAVLTAKADYILPNTSTREALAKAANELCDALIGEGCRA